MLHRGLRSRVEAAFALVRDQVRGIAVYVGYPEYQGDTIYNSAALVRDGQVLANHRKVALPNYAVFDEKRYFHPGDAATVVDLGGDKLGLIICEDVWVPAPCRAPAAAGAEVILVINGSPFHRAQQQAREQVLAMRAQENALPLIYVNMVGGQDELVFDGGSVVVDAKGRGPVPRAVVRGRPLHRGPRAHGRSARAACGCGNTRAAARRARLSRARARARATTSRRTASRAWCWGCPAASIRR